MSSSLFSLRSSPFGALPIDRFHISLSSMTPINQSFLESLKQSKTYIIHISPSVSEHLPFSTPFSSQPHRGCDSVHPKLHRVVGVDHGYHDHHHHDNHHDDLAGFVPGELCVGSRWGMIGDGCDATRGRIEIQICMNLYIQAQYTEIKIGKI